MSFSSIYVSRRKLKSEFFTQINKLISWDAVEVLIKQYYSKGYSVAGRPSYSGLLLFKMCLLQTWYGLSDYEVEEKVNDSLSFMQFVGLQLEDEVPDHSVISRFRSELTKKAAFEKIFDQVNAQNTFPASGNVGIGTLTPATSLQTIGTTRLGSATNYAAVDANGNLTFAGTYNYTLIVDGKLVDSKKMVVAK